MSDRWGEDRERRGESRLPAAGRICWKRLDKNIKFVGWLSDASPLSISFVTSAATQPSYGEELEVIRENDSRRRCRVMRLAPYDDHFSLIACRFVLGSSESRADDWLGDLLVGHSSRRRGAKDPSWDLDSPPA
ncbi:MAG TPA: hypothetical protein VMV94_11345 [Phycisphaerae bacterium]|nr:hypothetical protein [Phycisphaerae bacterium]